jgi:hypothetical protein
LIKIHSVSDDHGEPSAMWWPPSPAADLLRDVESVVPVVGAGLSTAVGLPSPLELARRLAKLAGDTPPKVDLAFFAAADAAYRSGKVRRGELNRMIADWTSSDANPDARPNAVHQALVRVGSRLIVTFNYDLLLEQAAKDQGLEFRSLTHRDTAELTDHLRSRHRGHLCIYHAHGSAEDPDTLVLDDASYQRIANDLGALRALEFLAELNTLCFLGTRLDEPYLQATLLRLPSVHPRHVLVCDKQTAAEVASDSVRGALLPTRYGIVTSAFPTGKWSCLEEFCTRLTAERETTRHISMASQESVPYVQYVEPPIRIRTRDAHSEIRAYLELAFPEISAFEIALPDIGRAWRAVIVGPAGCGKSSLLHRLGSLQAEVELPVIIDLASVTRFRGSSDELLRHWLRSGAAFHGKDISMDSRAVLLLDGLDEIDLRRQDEAAGAIAALADAFPQHRFIVASRVVPAVRLLAAHGFVEFEIHPTRWFADEFLASYGCNVKELKEQLPEASYLGALGSNPFVLTELLRLAEHMSPDMSRTERFRWLLDELVGAFSRREAERLAYSTDVLRETVGALAATMALHGLRTLDVTTYPFHTDATIIDSHGLDEFIQEAARRLLVWAEHSEFAFTEPIIKMYLAAEHVLRLDPDAQTLSHAIAPSFQSTYKLARVDGSATEVELACSGVRQDLVGLAALLASASPAWAECLFSSAPSLVARAVLPQATTPPQTERAEALWDALVESGEGNDARRTLPRMDTTEWLPGEVKALAAILRHRRQPALQARLRRTAQRTGAQPRLRGLALEVLAQSGRLSNQLLDRLAIDNAIPLNSISGAVHATRRLALLGTIVRAGTNTADSVNDRVIADIVGLMQLPGAGERIVEILGTLDPSVNERYFWKLVGVVRIHGSDDDVAALWKVMIGHHREALRNYLEAMPTVLGHMGLRGLFPRDGHPRLSQALMQEILALLHTIEVSSDAAATRREELLSDPHDTERRGAQTWKVAQLHTAEPASPLVKPDPPEANEVERGEGIPVLMVRDELSDMMRSVTYGLRGEHAINLIAWIPPDTAQEWEVAAGAFEGAKTTGEDPPETIDPLVQLDADLGQLPPKPDWNALEPLVERCRGLPFAVRAGIGARLEQRLPNLARDAKTTEREQLLSRYGSLLVLRPSLAEWKATAVDGSGPKDWLKSVVPRPDEIRAILRASSPADVPSILNAMPAEMRTQVIDEAAAVLASASPRSETQELAVARACADGAGDPEAITRLTESIPNPSPLFAGWAAAAGDASGIALAFAYISQEVLASRATALLERNHLEWVEAALGRVEPGALNVGELVMGCLHAIMASQETPGVIALAEILGTTACIVDPLRVAAAMELGRDAMGWTVLKEPFASLAQDAKDAAQRAAGSRAADQSLGVSLKDLKGQRVVVRFGSR